MRTAHRIPLTRPLRGAGNRQRARRQHPLRRQCARRWPHIARIAGFLAIAVITLSFIPMQDALADTATLRSGMSGDAVKALQTELVKRGYLNGADGKFGSLTLAAVKLFQKHAGLAQDGLAGQATQKALTGLVGSGKTNITLKQGATGGEVGHLQNRLIGLGYLSGTADSEYGAGTKAAVIEFQKKASLTSDGIAGPQTLVKLYSGTAVGSQPETPPPGETATTTTIKQGMSGEAVKAMQEELVKRGYLKVADGRFGSGTLAAVKLFQGHAGLGRDGIAGAKTLAALDKLTGSGKTNQTMKSGVSNGEVMILQQRLNELGYLEGTAFDNDYGVSTKAAVIKYQMRAGLAADGVAGPKTLFSLYSSTAPVYRTRGELVVEYAKQYLGVNYVYGSADPNVGFDCSGLVYYVYKQFFGVTLPRSSQSMTTAGTAVALQDARPGDILCFGDSIDDVGHVGIYVGNNQYIHAPQTGEVVKIVTLNRSVATVRRIFTGDD